MITMTPLELIIIVLATAVITLQFTILATTLAEWRQRRRLAKRVSKLLRISYTRPGRGPLDADASEDRTP